jgi:type IV secretory pathway VirB2 component (pilin)
MVYGNTAVVLMVIAVVAVVLGLVFGGTYCLSRDIDRNAR